MSPTTATSNITIVGLTRGSGITTTPTAASNAWGGNGMTETSMSNALTGNDFIYFSISANSGYNISINSINAYNVRRSSTGPTTGQWQYQIGSNAFVDIGTNITWGSVTTSSGNPQSLISLSGISELQSISAGTIITFRCILWGGTNPAGTWYLNNFQSGDDFIINGTTSVVPHSNISTTGTGTGTGTGTISWTLASGYSNATNSTLVFVKASSPITVGTPTNNVSSYTENTIFGLGTAYQNDPNAYCVFNGDGSSVNISGIADGTTYHVLVFNVADPNVYSSGATGSGVLPVELSSFSASVVGNAVKLNWRTETEVNNYGFEILRQAQDDKDWTPIGFVEGNGNSNSPKSYSFTDSDVLSGKYYYRLKQIDNDGQYEYSKTIEVDLGSPSKFELTQNFPNPFNPETSIRFTLPVAGNVKLTIYNLLGQEVHSLVNEYKEAGTHIINFNASDFNSGVYIYKLEANGITQTRKMTLIK